MSVTSPLPIDRPFGLSDDREAVQVSDSQTPLRGTNTSLPSSRSRRAGARVGRRQRSVVAAELSARDRLVLGRIEQHRYLSTMQLEAFVFTGHASPASAARTTRRVLARLARDDLIRPLARRIGGVRAGSSATVWQLAPAGVRLLRDEAGKGHRTHEPSERFLRHCLAVADAHLRLRAFRAAPDVEQIEVQVEPDSWRRFSGSGGEARWLQPDLAAVNSRIGSSSRSTAAPSHCRRYFVSASSTRPTVVAASNRASTAPSRWCSGCSTIRSPTGWRSASTASPPVCSVRRVSPKASTAS